MNSCFPLVFCERHHLVAASLQVFCMPTPLGAFYLVGNETHLVRAYFEGQKHCPSPSSQWASANNNALLLKASHEVEGFFQGTLSTFKTALAPAGTPFQRQVWQALLRLPRGSTTTYGDIARALGMPQASQAVGAAVGRNPLLLFIPCHRVLGKGGALTGYAGGLERKKHLLTLENKPLDV